MKNKTLHALTLSTMIVMTGCASYRASTLSMLPDTTLSEESGMGSKQNSNVTISWKAFDTHDCQTYLGRDVLSEGYIPVQLTIRNNSTDPMYLSPNNFNHPLSSVDQVASTVHTNTSGRVLAWGLPGLFFTPLFIPAFVDGIKSKNANEALDADYTAKALSEQTIQPHSSFNGVVFIPKERAGQTMEMFLVNLTTNKKVTFSDIHITQR